MVLEEVVLEAVALGSAVLSAVDVALAVRFRLATGERVWEAALFSGILNNCALDKK